MPECPRLWTNLSDEEFAMDIGFTKTEKQFSTFAYPLTNVGGHPSIGSCPSTNIGGHATIESCPSTNVGGHATIESCPSTNIGAQFPAESCTSTNVGGHNTIGKEELCFRIKVRHCSESRLHFRILRLLCHRALCRASRYSMQEKKALCRPTECCIYYCFRKMSRTLNTFFWK